MSVLIIPSDLWFIIIEFSYGSIKIGWNKKIWTIALVSKMYHKLVTNLFAKYLKNPIVNSQQSFLSKNDILNFLVKDVPVIETGFIYQEYIDQYFPNDKLTTEFTFKNILTNQNFFSSICVNKRCLVARSFLFGMDIRNNKADRMPVSIHMKPIVIVPIDNGSVYLLGSQGYYNVASYCYRGNHRPKILSYIYNSDDLIKIIQYVLNVDNPIARTIDEFVGMMSGYIGKEI